MLVENDDLHLATVLERDDCKDHSNSIVVGRNYLRIDLAFLSVDLSISTVLITATEKIIKPDALVARFAAARWFFSGFLLDLEGVSVEEDSDLKGLVTGTVEAFDCLHYAIYTWLAIVKTTLADFHLCLAVSSCSVNGVLEDPLRGCRGRLDIGWFDILTLSGNFTYYYAGMMFDADSSLLCSKLCRHNVDNPRSRTQTEDSPKKLYDRIGPS
ncbi:hypothetical protein P5673_012674 [Acropora cervicornis]|uniref:Uncharacterized protein n=1 Tax=Acropora cervicornis TaxID=6130 RepID=A0AAD9QM66_ACRCE|nr:hypothetical protein P5673_012674 [Acropora cervicornis]